VYCQKQNRLEVTISKINLKMNMAKMAGNEDERNLEGGANSGR